MIPFFSWETNGHLYVSLVEDILSQTNSCKHQLQGFQAAAQVLGDLDIQQHLHTTISSVTRIYVSTTDQSQQKNYRQQLRHQFLVHDSFLAQCSFVQKCCVSDSENE